MELTLQTTTAARTAHSEVLGWPVFWARRLPVRASPAGLLSRFDGDDIDHVNLRDFELNES